MATPTPKSYEQLLSDMLRTYMSKSGINDINTASTVSSFFECVAQYIYLANASAFSILRDFNADRASGEALKKIATEERVFPLPARVATGRIKIIDSSFSKIATKIYAGANAPNAGSTTIKVSDASLFPVTGSIYVGRGTNNVEGPIAYSAVTPVGGYYELTLSSPTTKFHNISESVIVAQGGNRSINAGTAVVAPASGGAEDVNFIITQSVILLDGENELGNIPIAAQEPGSQGNVPRGAIRRFVTDPFTGAIVTNDSQLTTGRDEESDAELRARVKRARLSKGLGTATAVRNAVLGAQSPEGAATVTSAEIFSTGSDDTVLYIDNGQGYEEQTEGVGIEFILDQALGGETNFQLATGGEQSSIAKAYLESNATAPFNIVGNDRLALLVGGVVSEHVFAETDFKAPGFATAYEVVASVNANSELDFSARTSENAQRVVFFAKAETNEYIQKTLPTQGTDAGFNLGLPENEVQTVRLYKNGELLSKDGRLAIVESVDQQFWNNTIVSGDTLIIKVDGTNFITYSILDADFISEGNFVTVNKNNTLQSWANVLNSKVTGITASVNGNKLRLISNLDASDRAAIEIDAASTLVSKGMFTSTAGLSAQGEEAGFKLSRNTAQIKLLSPLEEGDSLSTGNENTKAKVKSSDIVGGSVNFVADADIWILVDEKDAEIISTGVSAETLLTVSKPAANTVRYTSNIATCFQNTEVGDWVIIWSEELSAGNRLEARINAKTNTTIDLVVTASEYASAVAEGPIIFQEGFSVTRTSKAVQKTKILAGNYSLFEVADAFTENLVGAVAEIKDDRNIIITTKTESIEGSILIVDFNDPAKNLNFDKGQSSQSEFSLYGFQESEGYLGDFPLFFHSEINTDEPADPPTTLISDFDSNEDILAAGISKNALVCGAEAFGEPFDSVAKNECVQISDVSTPTVTIDENRLLRRFRIGDRYFAANPFDFSGNDTIVVILDNDPSNKTFPIPMYRKALINNTAPISPTSFRAYDVDSGATTEFATYFGNTYNFNNYKVMMQARNVIHPTSTLIDEDAILYRSVDLGTTGEKVRISYEYPTQPNLAIDSVITIEDLTYIKIYLKSGNPVSNTIDGTTEWDVTITPSGGFDLVTYTWNTVGTNPTIGVALSSGGYATINNNGEFSEENTGTFRVVSSTATSFTVSRPTGAAVTESNIATLTNTTITLFEAGDTTALEIHDYVNASLSSFLEAEIIDDNGTTGAGIIDRSTYEDSVFLSENVALVDGENFILSTNLTAIAPAPQFILKNPLSLPSFSTATVNAYAFNNGEEVRFIPTTAKQLEDFMNTLAVTGISTVGSVKAVQRDTKIQIRSDILGSDGSVQIAGGKGNASEAEILQSAFTLVGTDYVKTIVERSALSGLHGGQWVKLEATNAQKKNIALDIATNISTTVNSPVAGKTSIELLNRDNSALFFGRPRNFIRDRDVAFKVEKQGIFTAVIWDETTPSPLFSTNVDFNNTNGIVNVTYDNNTGLTSYTNSLGTRNFKEASRGDRFTIDGFTNPENNGSFDVVEVSDDGETIVVENFDGVEELGTSILAIDFTITAQIKEGDNVSIGEPFDILNQGLFRVIRRFNNSIWIENAQSVEEDVTVSANLVALTTDGTTSFDAEIVDGGVKISWNGAGTDPSLSLINVGDIAYIGTDFNALNQGNFMVNEVGTDYIVVENCRGFDETNILITDVFEAHVPSMIVTDYETTVANDIFTISGTVLGEDNIGRYVINKVLSRTKIIVDGLIDTFVAEPLSTNFTQIFVEEQEPYVGYKRIYNKAADPSNINQGIVIFDTSAQSEKINKDAGAVFVIASSKLDFPVTIQKGTDSYRYHIDLIRQANKIVYGEPRGGEYEGVAAAGAEIFIAPPLVRRIEVSIVVRLVTGVAFVKIIEQVRNNVSSLINSTGIGQSIAISDVVSVVNSIPGVFAVSIASPSYDISNDVIAVNPSEKPLVLDAVQDILVSKVGND